MSVGGQVGEALALASLPLAVADVEVDLRRAGQPLVPVGRDLHHNCVLGEKKEPHAFLIRHTMKSTSVDDPSTNNDHLFIVFRSGDLLCCMKWF